MTRFAGKLTFVTGATSGIGRASARGPCGCAPTEAAFTVGHAMVVDGGQTA
jgi:hypothetical protein